LIFPSKYIEIKEKYSKSILAQNFVKLFSATAISQLISVVSSFVLAYFFIPEEFGEFSIVLLGSNIISIFITLRTEYTLVIDNDNLIKNLRYSFILIFY